MASTAWSYRRYTSQGAKYETRGRRCRQLTELSPYGCLPRDRRCFGPEDKNARLHEAFLKFQKRCLRTRGSWIQMQYCVAIRNSYRFVFGDAFKLANLSLTKLLPSAKDQSRIVSFLLIQPFVDFVATNFSAPVCLSLTLPFKPDISTDILYQPTVI